MSVERLIAALRAGDTARAEVALTETGAAAVEPLVDLLRRDDDLHLRRGIAFIFARLRDSRIVPALIAALDDDPDAEVRFLAAQALADQADARAVEPLIGALDDAEAGIAEAAARALGRLAAALDSPRAVDALAEALHGSDWGTRQSAAEMLIALGADESDEAERLLLADLLSDAAQIQLGAARSLVELGDVRAVDPLLALLADADARIRVSAAYGLAKLGDQRAAEPLRAAFSHADEWVRLTAKAGLRLLADAP